MANQHTLGYSLTVGRYYLLSVHRYYSFSVFRSPLTEEKARIQESGDKLVVRSLLTDTEGVSSQVLEQKNHHRNSRLALSRSMTRLTV